MRPALTKCGASTCSHQSLKVASISDRTACAHGSPCGYAGRLPRQPGNCLPCRGCWDDQVERLYLCRYGVRSDQAAAYVGLTRGVSVCQLSPFFVVIFLPPAIWFCSAFCINHQHCAADAASPGTVTVQRTMTPLSYKQAARACAAGHKICSDVLTHSHTSGMKAA